MTWAICNYNPNLTANGGLELRTESSICNPPRRPCRPLRPPPSVLPRSSSVINPRLSFLIPKLAGWYACYRDRSSFFCFSGVSSSSFTFISY
ncbi:hypothetical protein FA15DRAFT_676301 [Coprinopsis marcescibilis]|uniref:Uncharacterized protein n=1 Tax=Coprinopsis marcescibilis TaxID=230819 RepID=A0A5C3KBT2_COPMA|nr:hypothetical protein FA15DRAFT_676301 [Coprinopsis marcescibilis]